MSTTQKPTWSELQSQALNRIWKGTKSEATASVNTQSAVEFFGPTNSISDLSVQQIDSYVDYLQAKGNSNATINRKLSALSKMLKFALDRERITKIPKIQKRKETSGRIRWLTKEEEGKLVTHFLVTASRPDVASLIVFLVDTGARAGEALGVKWKDITDDKVTFWDTKNSTPRSVPLTKRVRTLLNNGNSVNGDGPFSSVNYPEFNYLWQKAKKALGFESDDQFVPHCLRHTCASRLAQAGVPLITIKEFMGHKTIQITLRYAHLAPNQLDEAKRVLEAV